MNLTFKAFGHRLTLNEYLIKKRHLTEDDVKAIIIWTKAKSKLFTKMKHTKDIKRLRELANQVTRIEYFIQEAWHFRRNKNWHRFWLLPRCTCPVLDNRDRLGTKYSVISGDCIIHRLKEKK